MFTLQMSMFCHCVYRAAIEAWASAYWAPAELEAEDCRAVHGPEPARRRASACVAERRYSVAGVGKSGKWVSNDWLYSFICANITVVHSFCSFCKECLSLHSALSYWLWCVGKKWGGYSAAFSWSLFQLPRVAVSMLRSGCYCAGWYPTAAVHGQLWCQKTEEGHFVSCHFGFFCNSAKHQQYHTWYCWG